MGNRGHLLQQLCHNSGFVACLEKRGGRGWGCECMGRGGGGRGGGGGHKVMPRLLWALRLCNNEGIN